MVHKALAEAERDAAAADKTLADIGRAALVEALGDAVFELETVAHRGGLAKAMAIATHAHLFHGDKTGAPYFLHPLRMMLRMDTEIRRLPWRVNLSECNGVV